MWRSVKKCVKMWKSVKKFEKVSVLKLTFTLFHTFHIFHIFHFFHFFHFFHTFSHFFTLFLTSSHFFFTIERFFIFLLIISHFFARHCILYRKISILRILKSKIMDPMQRIDFLIFLHFCLENDTKGLSWLMMTNLQCRFCSR